MTSYGVARTIILPLCRLLFRVQVEGREHIPRSGVYILAPSHRSILDVPFAAFATRRRVRFMAKREIFTTKIGRRVFLALGAIEVDRGATDRGALRASKTALEAGEPLGIFPEGTRRTGPVIEDLYDGCAYLALKLGVPMVPVGIGGSEEIMPSGRVLPRLRRVAVVIGEPIEPPATTGVRRRSEVGDLTEALRIRLQACFDEATARVPRSGGAGPGGARPARGGAAGSGAQTTASPLAAERREDG